MRVAIAVVAAVSLTTPFGGAAAIGVPSGDGIEVTVTVELQASPPPAFVVMHVLTAGEQDTFSLGPAGEGLFRGTARLPAADRAVIFEAGWANGASSISETTSLGALGVSSDLLGDAFDIRTLDEESRPPWLAIAAAAGVAAVGLLATWWFLPSRLPAPAQVTGTEGEGPP